MENVLISIFLFELFFTMLLVINCAVDELFPIGEYRKWFQNKNWFGKIYVTIAIVLTIPAAIITYIVFLIVFLITFIHILGIKEEKKQI